MTTLNRAAGQSNNIPHRSYKHVIRFGHVIQRVQIERPHTRQQIHLVCTHEEPAFIPAIDFPEDEECNDDGHREIILKEYGGVG